MKCCYFRGARNFFLSFTSICRIYLLLLLLLSSRSKFVVVSLGLSIYQVYGGTRRYIWNVQQQKDDCFSFCQNARVYFKPFSFCSSAYAYIHRHTHTRTPPNALGIQINPQMNANPLKWAIYAHEKRLKRYDCLNTHTILSFSCAVAYSITYYYYSIDTYIQTFFSSFYFAVLIIIILIHEHTSSDFMVIYFHASRLYNLCVFGLWFHFACRF